eukprot:833802-Rhodomonas_salina.1
MSGAPHSLTLQQPTQRNRKHLIPSLRLSSLLVHHAPSFSPVDFPSVLACFVCCFSFLLLLLLLLSSFFSLPRSDLCPYLPLTCSLLRVSCVSPPLTSTTTRPRDPPLLPPSPRAGRGDGEGAGGRWESVGRAWRWIRRRVSLS